MIIIPHSLHCCNLCRSLKLVKSSHPTPASLTYSFVREREGEIERERIGGGIDVIFSVARGWSQ